MQYSYMISEKYVKGWTLKHAIREVISNALDACEGTDSVPVVEWDAGKATIYNAGVMLEKKHMLIGESDKTQDQIGQFGEGMKLAALVFVREGRMFTVHSGCDFYMFLLTHSQDFGCNTLAVDVDRTDNHLAGTRVEIECTESEIREAQALFSAWSSDTVLHTTSNGSKIVEQAGKISIMGVHVTDLPEALFGYDLHDKELLNRDRTIIDHDKVRDAISQMFYSIRDEDLIKAYLKALKANKDSFEGGMCPYLNSEWKKALHEVFGEKLCVISDKPADNSRAQYLGFAVLDLGHAFNRAMTYYCGVPHAKDVGCEDVTTTVPIKDLTADERKVYNAAIRLTKKVYAYNPLKRWDGTENVDIPVHVTEELKDGTLAQSTRAEMWLNRNILNDLAITTEAILHETVHQRTGYRDCTIQFQQALDTLIRRLVYLLLTPKWQGQTDSVGI